MRTRRSERGAIGDETFVHGWAHGRATLDAARPNDLMRPGHEGDDR
jgi:hypothetical protein